MLRSVPDGYQTRPKDKPGRRAKEAKPDGWEATGDNYSVDKFYCAASDDHGHSQVMSVRVSPVLVGMIGALVQDPNFPDIQTISDFFRDAAVHRMYYLKNDLGTDSILMADIQRELRRSEMSRIARRIESDERHIKATDEQLGILAARGDAETFNYVADMALDLADSFSEHNLRVLAEVIRKQRRVLKQNVDE